jgi:hypothetical protein
MITLVVVLLASSSASAVTFNVVGGQLLGASGVIVDGSSYNVEFLDGTCIALYNGCDEASDFTFQTEAAALLASQALLDQVFLDIARGGFDVNPELTTGCSFNSTCRAWTPYNLLLAPVPGFTNPAISGWDGIYAQNQSGATPDFVQGGPDSILSTMNIGSLTSVGADTMAVWTPVPEPGTGVLMGLGLLGLGVSNRRQR